MTIASGYAALPVHRFDAGDAVLAYRRLGAGPPLLLVHGFPLHGFTWRRVLPALAARFDCIVVDLAGFGDAEPGFGDAAWTSATDFGFHAHARRLRRLLDDLRVGPCHLMAQDTGATIARCVALQEPARAASLVLLNTEMPGHRPPWIREFQWMMRVPGARAAFRLLLRSPAWRRSGMGFGGCFHDPSHLDGEFHDAFVAPLLASPQRLDGMVRYLLGIGWDVVDAMATRHAELTMPVLLVWGEDDPTFPLPLARAMARQFPAGRGLAVIPRTRLLPHEERPDLVCEHVIPFLEHGTAVDAASS